MTGHNAYPAGQEEDTFTHQETVQFTDGEIALGFRTTGDKLVLGLGSTHKHARGFNGTGMAWIKTRSGNRYGLASGIVVNQNRRTAAKIPDEDLQVTIGEPLTIPGLGVTSEVESVLLRYKSDAPGSSMAQQQVDAPSPFPQLEAQVEAIQAANPHLS